MRILLAVLVSVCFSVRGQQFHNLDFSQQCDSSKTGLCHWDLSWGGSGAVTPATVNGRHCLRIAGRTGNAVGFAEQSAGISGADGITVITISAMVRSDSVEGKGAGLNIGVYDENDVLIANRDMGGFYSLDWIRGTTEWKRYSVSVVAPEETARVKIGAILYGKGRVYFSDYRASVSPIAEKKANPLAMEYIQAACDTIRLNSLVRDSIDINALKNTALKIAGPANVYSDCYLAVNFLLESLRPYGDHHSFFMTADEVRNWETEGSEISKITYAATKRVDEYGYILVPPFHGGNEKQMLDFADSLQLAIGALSKSGVKGWIVDLRQNTGGNMAPMVAGLGPLFSDGRLGSLIDVNGKPNAWYYKDGKYFWDYDPGWSVSNPVKLTSRLPIAVLTDGQTGSSGEAVTVSFVGNARTKLFGQPTWGLTTGNGSFELSDGATMFLASTIYADRNGRRYDGNIVPDFVVDIDAKAEGDPVMAEALRWLKGQE